LSTFSPSHTGQSLPHSSSLYNLSLSSLFTLLSTLLFTLLSDPLSSPLHSIPLYSLLFSPILFPLLFTPSLSIHFSSLRSSFLSSSLHPSLFTSLLYFLPYLVVLSCLMKHIAAVAQMPFCCCLSLQGGRGKGKVRKVRECREEKCKKKLGRKGKVRQGEGRVRKNRERIRKVRYGESKTEQEVVGGRKGKACVSVVLYFTSIIVTTFDQMPLRII
jgi:hypothetical protein